MNKSVPNKINILLACEESQAVCKEFRKLGFNAFSCDLYEESGGHPEWHIQGDCLPLLNGNCEFKTQDNMTHKIDDKWDCIIAFPPCTYLTVTGNRWFNVERYGHKAINRMKEREIAIEFFIKFLEADCDNIAVENPVGIMSTAHSKPSQIVQPYMFGDAFEKKTCLWLKGLPCLVPTNIVEPPERTKFASGKSMPTWYSDLFKLPKEERSKQRGKTFEGVANAMATQWGNFLLKGIEMSKLKVLELFSGIGACSKALTNLGIDYEVVDSVEIDKYAVKSFNAIHGTNFEPQDITEWDKDVEIDLLMGSFPCQDISLAGKQKGIVHGETRSGLMYEMMRIVEKLKPKYVITENVKNLLSIKFRPQLEEYLTFLSDNGYSVTMDLLNSKNYGIPQSRERVFIIGVKDV